MKLKTKHEFFMQIKSGKKLVERRSAHITFIDEETGAKLPKNIKRVWMESYDELPKDLKKPILFDGDEPVICYELEREK